MAHPSLPQEQLLRVETESFRIEGVVTYPSQPLAGSAWVLIPNSGLVHRVGTCRSSVTLARFLAAQGIHVCRFDLSNLGDSGPRQSFNTATDDQRIDADY